MTHERISPTAWLVAYQRTLSDLPLASEVFLELEEVIKQNRSPAEIERLEALKSPKMAVMWEARFKIVNHFLKTCNLDQFLEVAAGFSTRGMIMAGDPKVTYVEVDLPGLVHEKKHIVEALIAKSKLPERPNFHLAEGNALDLEDLLSATRFFNKDKPIAVLNEGLLPYLNQTERTAFAGNVHALLERFGGVWITPDIDVRLPEATSGRDRASVKARTGKIEELTGVDVLKNRFESKAAALAFFENLGFYVEQHSFLEVADKLVLPPPGSLARKAIGRGLLFVMRAAGQ